jgi:hypothetical protein
MALQYLKRMKDAKLKLGWVCSHIKDTVTRIGVDCGDSRNQWNVTRSSTKVEYYALADYCKSKAWIKGFINELKVHGYELRAMVTYKGHKESSYTEKIKAYRHS